jgi:hypothetical protein
MTYKNITHNLEIVSEKQKTDFILIETLLEKLNSIKPSQVNLTKLKYLNNTFKVDSFGFMHSFLLNDIEQALLGNQTQHKEFIINKVRSTFKGFKTDFLNTKTILEALIKYYTDYPLYFETDDFQNYISDINESIQKEFLK